MRILSDVRKWTIPYKYSYFVKRGRIGMCQGVTRVLLLQDKIIYLYSAVHEYARVYL